MSEDDQQSSTIQEWSDKQLKAIGLLADIDKAKSLNEVAEAVGVERTILWIWRQKPEFLAEVKNLRDKNTKWKVTPVLNKLFDMAIKGDIQAIKMALQVTSELGDGTNQTNVNVYPVRELTPKEIKAYNDEFEDEC